MKKRLISICCILALALFILVCLPSCGDPETTENSSESTNESTPLTLPSFNFGGIELPDDEFE